MSASWRERRRSLTRPAIATPRVHRVLGAAAVASTGAVTWPAASPRADRGMPVELSELFASFTRAFARADAEIEQSSNGRVVMVLDDSSIEVRTVWVGDDDRRFLVAM
jgi:hypothetical protein